MKIFKNIPKNTFTLIATTAISVAVVVVLAISFKSNTQSKKRELTQIKVKPTPIITTVVLPSIDANDISDWRLYSNEFYSIKYPPNYNAVKVSFVSKVEYKEALSFMKFENKNGHTVVIAVAENYKNLTLDNALGNGPNFSYTKDILEGKRIQKLIISGVKGVMAEGVNAGITFPNSDLIIIDEGNIYQLTSTPDTGVGHDNFTTMLKTFTLTK